MLHPFSQGGVLLVLFKKDSNHAPVCEELVLSNVDLKHQSSLFYLHCCYNCKVYNASNLEYWQGKLSFIFELVAPKRKRLQEAESTLSVQMSHLNEKRGELKEVMDKLQNLNDDYTSKVNKKEVIVNYKQNYEKLQVMAMMAW